MRRALGAAIGQVLAAAAFGPQIGAAPPDPRRTKRSSRRNELERHGNAWYENACASWRAYNPARDNRRQLEAKFGVSGGRQWKKLRRRIRAQYGDKVAL